MEGGVPVGRDRSARLKLRSDFMAMAGEAFDAMFDADQQEQLITLTQREDRVLQKGAELQRWLLARHLALDPAAGRPAGSPPARARRS